VGWDIKANSKGDDQIYFEVSYEEDKTTGVHSYAEIRKYLDPLANDEAMYVGAFCAQDVVDDTKADYLPDIVATRREMLRQPDAESFIQAEDVEMRNMETHWVFRWVHPPRCARLVRCKWTYRRKRDGVTGEITKLKSRLVACGYSQLYDKDYTDTYAPTASQAAFHIQLVLAMTKGMSVTTMDIDGAYLNGLLDEEIYMMQPDGREDPEGEGRVIQLVKSIYGLKQSAFVWFNTLVKEIVALGYTAIDGSNCAWHLYNGDEVISMLTMHIDDVVHCYTQEWLNERLVGRFTELWGVSSVGPIEQYLGMSIEYKPGVLVRIDQRAYIDRVLKRFSFEGIKTVSTLMDPAVKLSMEDCPEEVDMECKQLFQEIYGSLLYAAVCTRPDISKAMTALGRFMASPGQQHLQALKRVL